MGQSQGGFSDEDSESGGARLIKFHLFVDKTRLNTEHVLEVGAKESLAGTGYKPGLGLTILIHGFNTTYKASFLQAAKNALLRQGVDTNVVMADYNEISRGSGWGGGILHFPAAFKKLPIMASNIADFIVFLTESGFLDGPQSVHLIGESLGAQIAGFTGKEILKRTGNKIQRITGLDPAGPLFQGAPENRRLCPADARFVDVVHSNQGALGYKGSTGHVDFYLNGGGPIQPKYRHDDDDNWLGLDRNDKSHAFSVEVFSETILHKVYHACACYAGEKPCEAPAKDCPNAVIFGYNIPPSTRGEYYVTA